MTYARDDKYSGEWRARKTGERDPAILVGWISIAFIASLLVVGLFT